LKGKNRTDRETTALLGRGLWGGGGRVVAAALAANLIGGKKGGSKQKYKNNRGL